MKKYQRSELAKMNKNDLMNLIIEIQDNIILTKDMANRNGRPKLKISEETKNNILFLHHQGKGSRYIGEAVGMSHTKVTQILKEMI